MEFKTQAWPLRVGAKAERTRVAPAWRIALPFSERKMLLVFGDGALINGAVILAMGLWAWIGHFELGESIRSRWFWCPLLTGLWWIGAWFLDLYDVHTAALRRKVTERVVGLVAGLLGCYLIVYFVLPRNVLPRLFFLFFSATILSGMLLWRWSYATVFRMPHLCRRVLIVGAGWAGTALTQMLSGKEVTNCRAVGFVDDDPAKQGETIAGLPVLGASADLTALVRKYGVDEVVVAITHNLSGQLFQALMDCRAIGVHIVRMPDLYEQLTRRVPVEHVSESWVLEALNGSSMLGHLERMARRGVDLVLATVGLVGLATVWPLVALATFLDDRGPVFYTQVRLGLGGKPFHLIKIRTMRRDAEEGGLVQWAQQNDERVTRVGRFLRRVRLDELPQVINVLRGEMRIVGPRPERPEFIIELEKQIPFYRTRLVVKPGLTGWAQIHYPYGNTVQDALVKLQYDLYYIRHRSIWLDLYTVWQTVGVVLSGNGT